MKTKILLLLLLILPIIVNAKTTELPLKQENIEFSTLQYIKEKWIELTGLFLGIIVIIVPLVIHLSQINQNQKDKRFIVYHQLIEELVNPPTKMLDRQIAVVYELRNFSKYYDLSLRILSDLKNQWTEDNSGHERLIKEMNLTISYIEASNNVVKRIFYRRFKAK